MTTLFFLSCLVCQVLGILLGFLESVRLRGGGSIDSISRFGRYYIFLFSCLALNSGSLPFPDRCKRL